MTMHLEHSDMIFAPAAELRLSPMNPRQMVTDEEIDEMASSIMACGLIQGLSGYLNDDGQIEIVAGGRRLRALQLLASEQFKPAPDSGLDLARIPVKLTTDLDLAAKWAMAENAARKAPNIADEIQAYAALAARGASVTNIARAYAVTEIHVKRRLKLANLPVAALDALRADKIGYGQAAVMTMCQSEEQFAELLSGAIDKGWAESRMRQHIAQDKIKGDSWMVKYVRLDAYESAGGEVIRDLFTDFTVLADGDLIDRLYRQKLVIDAVGLQEKLGFAWREPVFEPYLPYEKKQKFTRIWPEVETLAHTEAEALEYAELDARAEIDDLDDVEEARYADLAEMCERSFSDAQRLVSGIFVWVDYRGALCHEAGFIAPEHYDRAAELGLVAKREGATAGKANGELPAEETGLSATVVADLKAIRLAAVQSALLNVPDLLADLLAYALSPHAPRYNGVFDIRIGKPSIVPSIDDAFTLDDRLAEDSGRDGDLVDGFAVFRKLSKAKRQAALHEAIARALNYGCVAPAHKPSPLFDVLESEADAGMRKVWRPTKANFFGRVPSSYLDQVYCEVFALDAADGAAKAFAGLKKSEKATKLDMIFDIDGAASQGYVLMTPESAKRIAAWQPAQF